MEISGQIYIGLVKPRAKSTWWLLTEGWRGPGAGWLTENPYPAGNRRSVARDETPVVWGLHGRMTLRFEVFWDVLADVPKERSALIFKDRGVQE